MAQSLGYGDKTVVVGSKFRTPRNVIEFLPIRGFS